MVMLRGVLAILYMQSRTTRIDDERTHRSIYMKYPSIPEIHNAIIVDHSLAYLVDRDLSFNGNRGIR
jgi:hypothetical protein